MTVFVSVTLERQREEALAEFEAAVEPMTEVIEGFLMSSGSDYLLHVLVRDLHHYEAVLARLTRAAGLAHIQSSFALRTFIRGSAVIAE